MRKLPLAVVLFWVVACSPEGLAGLQPAGTSATVNELSHSVGVRFDTGVARLKVKRQLRNDSQDFQSLTHHLELPGGAIATGLSVGTDGRFPQPATLTGSEDATARWDLLTGPGNAVPSTLGLLEWSSGGGLDLQVFGLAPGSTVSVEYDVELSPDYAAGELQFDYPRELESAGWIAPHFEVAVGALTEVVAEGEPTEYRLHQRTRTGPIADVRWATYPIDIDRTLWRLEVDAAPELEHAPVRPHVVFVVDGSHSEGTEGIAAQLELIAPYLENARDAQVEIVIYRRFAERLFGRFEPAHEVARLIASIPQARLAPGNGSNLELGAGLAAQALAQAGGVSRMVIFTDEALRDGFSNEVTVNALAAAPGDTVVHVVARGATTGHELSEHRDDEAPLAAVAAARGGIFLRVDGHAENPVLSADTLLGLVRPIRIDSFSVEAKGVPDDQLFVEPQLREGSAVRQSAICAQPPTEITLTGKIWARDFRRVVSVDPALSNRLPGIAVGDDLLRNQLDDDELRTVAFASHAVSPVTSYLAVPADAAPSTIGVSAAFAGFGLSDMGCGGCGGSTTCGWGSTRRGFDLDALLRALLVPGVAACNLRHGDTSIASLRLEATGDEVVAVEVTSPSVGLTDCITEAAWAIRLPPEFVSHRSYAVALLK